MTSAQALWFPDFLLAVADALVIGKYPAVPPVAHDGLRPSGATTSAPATFLVNTIMRAVGDFRAEGWSPGMTATVSGSTDNDGEWLVVESVSALQLVFSLNVEFTAELAGDDVTITGEASGFALYTTSTDLGRWTGPNAAHIVPSFGMPVDAPPAFRSANLTTTPARPLEAIWLGVDVHIWGAEPIDVSLDSYRWGIERLRAACNILQDIVRVLSILSTGFGSMASVAGWTNDTEALRYGEQIIFSWRAQFAVYDFPDPQLSPPIGPSITGYPIVLSPEAA